ncbi:MAG: hypothetical protein J0L89_08445 [Xanthomonadales bacterium]|nr:hypothetical protein [Xanthomonadales bacterium]
METIKKLNLTPWPTKASYLWLATATDDQLRASLRQVRNHSEKPILLSYLDRFGNETLISTMAVKEEKEIRAKWVSMVEQEIARRQSGISEEPFE